MLILNQEDDGMLANYFPQTEKLLGTKLFSELASHFHGNDFAIFPQYLKENLPDIEVRYSFTPELSRLELTVHTAQLEYQEFHPAQQSLRPLQTVADAKKVNISLSPNIRLFKSRFPVWEIWEECKQACGTPDLINLDLQPKIKTPYFYIINQGANGPKAYPIKKKIFHLIEGIQAGSPFGDIAEKLYAHKDPIVLSKALSKIQSLKLIEKFHIDQR